jgi:hypothetical protein
MTEIEQRACIKIFTTLNQSPTNIHDNLVNVYGEASYSYRNLARCVALFKAGIVNLEDETRSERPIRETIKANVELVEILIGKNPSNFLFIT